MRELGLKFLNFRKFKVEAFLNGFLVQIGGDER